MQLRRRALVAGAGVFLAGQARAADQVAVGVLRFVSSGGLFLAQEHGHFAREGILPGLVFFDAAQPIAVAVASGDLGFGVTSLTGGTLNLAGRGALKVVASQGAERRGYRGTALLASNAAFARGLTAPDKLPGAAVAITQVGSSQHYMFGQIATAGHFDLGALTLRPLQSVPNMIAALRGGQVDAALLPPQFAKPLLARGEAHLLAYMSDIADYQYGAVFAAPKLVSGSPDLVRRFVRAYQRGNADYAAALLRTDADGELVVDEAAREAAASIAKYVAPGDPDGTESVLAAAVFVDASGALNLPGIDEQIAWYQAQKLVNPGVQSATFVDPSFLH